MVRATFAGFSTALSAIQANQKRLDIVGQNLANMNTVGYTRQQLETSSINYTNPVSHYMNGSEVNVGFGVRMDRVSQIRDPYLDVQYRDQIVKSSYNDAIQTSLDALANVFDESNIKGIRNAFDDIQSTLTNMQDSSKINNPIYESELRSRMQALTNLINDAARQIEAEESAEFQRLDGTGTSEQGAVQQVNDILKQIGNLNIQIKRNQIHGQPSLELMDERNVLLDELASFIPIEVTYSNERSDEEGWKDWPDDLKVELLYTDEKGDPQRLTLIDGVKGGEGKNYGKLAIGAGSSDNPTSTVIQAFKAQGLDADAPAADDAIEFSGDEKLKKCSFGSGSIQASLDMLGKDYVNDTVRGYQFYMNQLNTLAKGFADVMNYCNKVNAPNGVTKTDILTYDTVKPGNEAKTIGVSQDWVNGDVCISTGKVDANDTVHDMLNAMSNTWPSANWPSANNAMNPTPDLDDNSFADYMNHISTLLANDSSHNKTALETNVTILNGIQDSRDSMSAVSLDEEAANMMTFQAAYNAASRLMTTLDQMLDTLINNTGVVGR